MISFPNLLPKQLQKQRTMKVKEYRFIFDGWHINIKLQADDLQDAVRRFRRLYKKEFNGKIESL